jgi:hypothetical protein
MERDRPRSRFRISTLMLLVVVAALAAALFVERQRRIAAERRAQAEADGAWMKALAELAAAQLRGAIEKTKGSGSQAK